MLNLRVVEEFENNRVGFGMRFRAAKCAGCERVLVQRDWRKLKPMHTTCAYCGHSVYFVKIQWPGYVKRMEDGARLISV